MQGNSGSIRVGIGGWVFPPWRGTFYPKGLRQADELAHASRHVTAIEINGTFYRIQTPASFRKWHAETPDDFMFSLKGPRFLTHRGELASAAPYMERFFQSGFLELGEKLGPLLWQFAPTLEFAAADFAAFLTLLPRELEGRPLRHVVEVRHPSFRTPEFFALLRQRNVAVALVDDAKYPGFTGGNRLPARSARRMGRAAQGLGRRRPRLLPLLHQRRQSPRPRRRPGAARSAQITPRRRNSAICAGA